MGLAAARALALALDVQVAGVSTLEALASGAPGALPVIDARRREVFTLIDGEPVAIGPDRLGNSLLQGRICVGDGAVRYREILEQAGAEVPPDEASCTFRGRRCTPALARDFGPAELVEPDLRPRSRRGQGARTMIEYRKLKLRDLNSIEEIERSSYPTPWSRSMFAGELAKPSSICLGAVDAEQNELVGYLIISRYVDAWHVMNVAVAEPYRRRGIASGLWSACSRTPRATAAAGTRSRCESRTRPRSGSTSGSDSRREASGAATTRTTARTR